MREGNSAGQDSSAQADCRNLLHMPLNPKHRQMQRHRQNRRYNPISAAPRKTSGIGNSLAAVRIVYSSQIRLKSVLLTPHLVEHDHNGMSATAGV